VSNAKNLPLNRRTPSARRRFFAYQYNLKSLSNLIAKSFLLSASSVYVASRIDIVNI